MQDAASAASCELTLLSQMRLVTIFAEFAFFIMHHVMHMQYIVFADSAKKC